METTQQALEALLNWGAKITPIEDDQYIVTNDGRWGLIEEDFIVDSDELIELATTYIQHT